MSAKTAAEGIAATVMIVAVGLTLAVVIAVVARLVVWVWP